MAKHKRRKGATIITAALLLIFAVIAYFILSDYIERKIYVLEYKDIIEEASNKYELDPYLVCAVIYTESKFDDDAVSKVDAKGLMQLMPDTGEWIAKKLKLSDYTVAALLIPRTNIEMGCWYLNYLYDKFDGDTELVLAAYNAGPATVSGWLKDTSISSDGKTLSYIPYDETDNYIKRVNSAYEKYKSLYKDAFN